MHDIAARLAGRALSADEALVREFEARLSDSASLAFRVAYSVLRHREDAEDVAQEAFARAYRRFSTLRDRDRFRAWLVRMTWRLALDRRRGDRRRLVRDGRACGPVDGGAQQGAEAALVERQRAERLWRAIDALPDRLREVTVLAAIEEHGIREVAALLRLPEGTVKSRLFDARRKLQELLT
jgi:RNA polymerase sigma-70 factor, ECF subfamily